MYSINLCEMEKSMHFNPFVYIRSRSDISKLISNLIQNTNTQNIKNSSQDPFWERAEKMFLESIFLYVWMKCPMDVYDEKLGRHIRLEKNWKSVIYLIDPGKIVLYGRMFDNPYYLSRLLGEMRQGVDTRHDVTIEKSQYNHQLEQKAACLLAVEAFFDNGGVYSNP